MVDVAAPAQATDNPRAAELERLIALLNADQGSVVVLHGRRGVGKERLADDLVRHASAQAASVVFEGRTLSAAGKSFHPFAEVAHQAILWAEQNNLTAQILDPLYGDLAPVLDLAAAGDEAPSLDQKLAFFDAFRRLLIGVSEAARLLVVIHDLEHADKDTLELAGYLADELFGDPALDPEHPRPGLLTFLVRDDASTPERVKDFLGEIAERTTAEALLLEGLDLDGLRRYVQSSHVLEKLLSACEGLPQELDALIDALPTNVEELFEKKLASLDEPCRRALRALAVFGRPASARLLARVADLALKDTASALSTLRDSKIVDRKIHNGEFQFAFNRRRDLEVTLRSLAEEERAGLHGAWATALTKEQDHGGPALLAHHQLRSSEPQRGVPLAVQAAETYAVAGAFDAALGMLEDARPHAQGELYLSILARLAELAPLTGHPRTALRYVEAWKAALPIEARGPAHQREAELRNATGDYDQALLSLEEAKTITADLAERASIEAKASEAYYHLGELEKAAACGRAGIALLDQTQAETTVKPRIDLTNQLGKIALADDQPERAVELFETTRALAEGSGLVRELAGALVNLGITHLRTGDATKAEANLLEGIEKARDARDLWRIAFGYMNLGVVYHQNGELGRAIECYRECKSLFRRLGNRTQLARVLHNLGNLYLICGDPARAKAHNDEALRLARLTGVERVVAIAISLEGAILAEMGLAAEGEAKLREAMVLQRKLAVERPLEAMVELVELQLRFGELDRAEATLFEVKQALVSVESPLLAARAVFLEAKLLGAGETAIRMLEEARAEFERRQRRLFVRDAELELGRAHFAAGQLETARMHIMAAHEIQSAVAEELPEDLRAKFLAARSQTAVREAMAELEGRPAPRPRIERTERTIAISAPPPAARTERTPEWRQKYAAIVGGSSKLNRVFHILDRVAASEGTVLIYGESGTGKELVAEAIHRSSPRAKGAFVKLNCAALVETLLLSELFGHEKGSFTGAHQRKIGRFEMASGGTLFLDEIGDISPKTQVALLRVLQEREFERVGGGRPIKVEARIIFATNRNLAKMVKDGAFREDLYYRLKGLTIDMPPLRERPEDIVELAQHFLAQYAAESGTVEKSLSGASIELLQSYGWPGNIRELENIIRSVALFCEGNVIDVRDFDEYRELFQEGPVARTPIQAPPPPAIEAITPPPPTSAPPGPPPDSEVATRQAVDGELLSQIFELGVPLPELKRRIQEQAIARALRLTKGNITRAAEVLGMRRPRLSQIINGSEELKSLCQGVIR